MAMPDGREDREYDKFVQDASGNTALRTQIVVQDIEIGAVELKNGTSDVRAEVNDALALKTQEIKPTGAVQGTGGIVTTAGVRVALMSSGATTVGVTIKAKLGNTGTVYAGNSTVTVGNGFPLAPGDTLSMAIADTDQIQLDADNDGDGVNYLVLHAPIS